MPDKRIYSFRLVFYNNFTSIIYNYLVFLCYPADASRSSLVFLCENIYCYYLFSNECRKHNNYLLFYIQRTRNVWRASTRDKRWHVQLKGISVSKHTASASIIKEAFCDNDNNYSSKYVLILPLHEFSEIYTKAKYPKITIYDSHIKHTCVVSFLVP